MSAGDAIPKMSTIILVLILATIEDVRWLDALICALGFSALLVLFFLLSTSITGDSDADK